MGASLIVLLYFGMIRKALSGVNLLLFMTRELFLVGGQYEGPVWTGLLDFTFILKFYLFFVFFASRWNYKCRNGIILFIAAYSHILLLRLLLGGIDYVICITTALNTKFSLDAFNSLQIFGLKDNTICKDLIWSSATRSIINFVRYKKWLQLVLFHCQQLLLSLVLNQFFWRWSISLVCALVIDFTCGLL